MSHYDDRDDYGEYEDVDVQQRQPSSTIRYRNTRPGTQQQRSAVPARNTARQRPQQRQAYQQPRRDAMYQDDYTPDTDEDQYINSQRIPQRAYNPTTQRPYREQHPAQIIPAYANPNANTIELTHEEYDQLRRGVHPSQMKKLSRRQLFWLGVSGAAAVGAGITGYWLDIIKEYDDLATAEGKTRACSVSGAFHPHYDSAAQPTELHAWINGTGRLTLLEIPASNVQKIKVTTVPQTVQQLGYKWNQVETLIQVGAQSIPGFPITIALYCGVELFNGWEHRYYYPLVDSGKGYFTISEIRG